MIRQLDRDAAFEVLRGGRLGRLGCVSDGEAYVVPVYYIVEDESVYVHSRPGRKVRAMRAHPRACLQVDDVANAYRWRSAIAYGDYEEIAERDERARLLERFAQKFSMLTPVESLEPSDSGHGEIVVFRLRITRVDGVAEGS